MLLLNDIRLHMKYKNIQYIVKAPIYIRKKHYCPDCNVLVTVVKTSRIVHAGSEEAARMGLDFSMIGGVYQNGKVNVMWKEFECPQCKQRISVERMKEIEGYPI